MQLKPPPPKQMFNLHECDDTEGIVPGEGSSKAEFATHSPWQKNAESPGGIGCFGWRPPANLYTQQQKIKRST